MEVNFVLPASVTSGTMFSVVVTAKHLPLGSTVDLLLEQVGTPVVPPGWRGPVTPAPALAAPGAPDGAAQAIFQVTLVGAGRAQLQATANVAATGDLDLHVEHVDVL